MQSRTSRRSARDDRIVCAETRDRSRTSSQPGGAGLIGSCRLCPDRAATTAISIRPTATSTISIGEPPLLRIFQAAAEIRRFSIRRQRPVALPVQAEFLTSHHRLVSRRVRLISTRRDRGPLQYRPLYRQLLAGPKQLLSNAPTSLALFSIRRHFHRQMRNAGCCKNLRSMSRDSARATLPVSRQRIRSLDSI